LRRMHFGREKELINGCVNTEAGATIIAAGCTTIEQAGRSSRHWAGPMILRWRRH
jgi:hypothetical protein